ncbi:MAG: efflux RND transporter periplasmic adaptor subunit [Anaerolineales bacterium]|nr:efflux RND transporter periplasmic adaptor subunit [Anaerolineales bacterium]
MNKNLAIASILVVTVMLLSACGGNSEATPTSVSDITPVVDSYNIIAEGNILPINFVSLSFETGGLVGEVMVEEGSQVKEGDVILQLNSQAALESAVANAEMEKVNAQKALDDLTENVDLARAQAELAIANAQDAIRDADRKINNMNNGSDQTDIDSAKANMILLEDQLDDAEEDYEPYEDKPEDNLTRARYLSALADTQAKYDDAVRNYNNLIAEANEIDLAIAKAELAIAEAQLRIAESDYAAMENGPDPEALEIAEARVRAANAAFEAAQVALDNSEIKALFSGTVVQIDAKEGEMVSPGVPVVVLADLSKWIVETDNLTEIEVVDVEIGQHVLITPDALPDVELSGTVTSISEIYMEKLGDVTYTCEVQLDDNYDNLRWGMTVVVTFEK